jgi:hypothetical protein
MTNADEPLLTRDQIVECVREKLGIPITKNTIEKAAWKGTGPKPEQSFGKTLLYKESVALAWARTLVSPVSGGSPNAA